METRNENESDKINFEPELTDYQQIDNLRVPTYENRSLAQLSSSGHSRRAIAPARLDTRLNESRRVIDLTPREVQFFIKSY